MLTLDVEPADSPIEDHPLAWRWTSPTHGNFSEEMLRSIVPLTQRSAQSIEAAFDPFLSRLSLVDGATNEGMVLHSVDCERVDTKSETYVTEWMSSRIGAIDRARTQFVVEWWKEMAVQVPAALFLDKWDDFFYPLPDQAFVFEWPLPSWIIYWDEEFISFGRFAQRTD